MKKISIRILLLICCLTTQITAFAEVVFIHTEGVYKTSVCTYATAGLHCSESLVTTTYPPRNRQYETRTSPQTTTYHYGLASTMTAHYAPPSTMTSVKANTANIGMPRYQKPEQSTAIYPRAKKVWMHQGPTSVTVSHFGPKTISTSHYAPTAGTVTETFGPASTQTMHFSDTPATITHHYAGKSEKVQYRSNERIYLFPEILPPTQYMFYHLPPEIAIEVCPPKSAIMNPAY